MNASDPSSQDARAAWWLAQRNNFGLPDALYAPLPFGVLLAAALGAGCAFIGLYPGVSTLDATLSGVGAPWIGLGLLLLLAALLYWRALRHAYAPLPLALIVGAALLLDLLVNALALDLLLPEQADALIGGLGLLPMISGLLLLLGLLFEGLVLSTLMGTLMGALLGGLMGFVLSEAALLIMLLIYTPLGALAGLLGGLLRPLLLRLRGR